MPRPPRPDEPQSHAAHLAHLRRELASHPSRGLTPAKLARILDEAEAGNIRAQAALFEDMEEKDAHIASELAKRRRACMLPWRIVPPDDPSGAEVQAAQVLQELLEAFGGMEDVLFDLTDAIGKGFAACEIQWQRQGRFWLPQTIVHRPQGWFVVATGFTQELRLRTHRVGDDGQIGQALQPLGWIVHRHRAKSGALERSAMFRQLVWTYLFKNYSVGDLAEFLEIYGIPLRVGKYPLGATERDKMTLLRALSGIGHNAAGIVPEGMMIEFHEAARGDPAAFELMIDWCEKNQSKVILGGTLTSGADGKSSTHALGRIHDEVRRDLRDSDIGQICATIRRDLLAPMCMLGGLGGSGHVIGHVGSAGDGAAAFRCPHLVLDVQEAEDIAQWADALPKLAAAGLQIPVQWAQEKLGIPQPQNGEAVMRGSHTGQPPLEVAAASWQPPRGVNFEKPETALAAQSAQPRPKSTFEPVGLKRLAGHESPLHTAHTSAQAGMVEAQTQQLAHSLAPHGAAWVEAIRAAVERAHSLEELRDALDAALPDLGLDEWAAAMGQALVAAQLAGRWEVLSEAAAAGHRLDAANVERQP